MTALTEEMYGIFDQPEFSFKKIKEQHTPAEVDQLKPFGRLGNRFSKM